MKRFTIISIAVMALTAVCAPVFAQAQRMANPSYFYPGPLWTKLEAAAPQAGLAIMNPNSGPGAAFNADYGTQVKQAQADGLLVLGYVHTSYGKRSLDVVSKEASEYFQWYHVDGIFYDEVANTDADLPYYVSCYTNTHQLSQNATVMINPGTPVTEGYMKACDIVCTFESDFNAYQTQYQQPAWVTNYPASRFFHIILNVPTVAEMLQVVKQSKARNAGWVFVTPYGANNQNPYDKLPDNPYWNDELKALKRK